jgi:hypothetical protein
MNPNKLTPGHNVRWESSRMMIPQHVDALLLHKLQQRKKERPHYDEQHTEETERMIRDFIRSDIEVFVTIFGEYEDRDVRGKLTKVDSQLRRVRIDYEDDYEWISFNDIIDVFM